MRHQVDPLPSLRKQTASPTCFSLASRPGSPSAGVSQVTIASMGRSEVCGDRDEHPSPLLDICSSAFSIFSLLPHSLDIDILCNSLTSSRSRRGPAWFLQRPLPLASRWLSSCLLGPHLVFFHVCAPVWSLNACLLQKNASQIGFNPKTSF